MESLFKLFEPLTGWRHVELTASRPAFDRAHVVNSLADSPRYREAEMLVLVMDHLNTHTLGSPYEAFAPRTRPYASPTS